MGRSRSLWVAKQGRGHFAESTCVGRWKNKRMEDSAEDPGDQHNWVTAITLICGAQARQECESDKTTDKIAHDETGWKERKEKRKRVRHSKTVFLVAEKQLELHLSRHFVFPFFPRPFFFSLFNKLCDCVTTFHFIPAAFLLISSSNTIMDQSHSVSRARSSTMPDSFCFAEDFLAQLRSGLLLCFLFLRACLLVSLSTPPHQTQRRHRRQR